MSNEQNSEVEVEIVRELKGITTTSDPANKDLPPETWSDVTEQLENLGAIQGKQITVDITVKRKFIATTSKQTKVIPVEKSQLFYGNQLKNNFSETLTSILALIPTISLCDGIGGSAGNQVNGKQFTVDTLASHLLEKANFHAFSVVWHTIWTIHHTCSWHLTKENAKQLPPTLGFLEKWGVGLARFTGALIKQTSLLFELPLRGLDLLLNKAYNWSYTLRTGSFWPEKVMGWLFWPFILILKSLVCRLANVVAYSANLIVNILNTVVDSLRLITWTLSALLLGKPSAQQVIDGPLTSLLFNLGGMVLNVLRLAPEAAIILLYIFFPPAAVILNGLYSLMPGTAIGGAILATATTEAVVATPAQLYTLGVNLAANKAATALPVSGTMVYPLVKASVVKSNSGELSAQSSVGAPENRWAGVRGNQRRQQQEVQRDISWDKIPPSPTPEDEKSGKTNLAFFKSGEEAQQHTSPTPPDDPADNKKDDRRSLLSPSFNWSDESDE